MMKNKKVNMIIDKKVINLFGLKNLLSLKNNTKDIDIPTNETAIIISITCIVNAKGMIK